MANLLDEDNLKREPIHISDDYWCYEEKNGFSLYSTKGGNIGNISLRTIRAYIKRLDAKK